MIKTKTAIASTIIAGSIYLLTNFFAPEYIHAISLKNFDEQKEAQKREQKFEIRPAIYDLVYNNEVDINSLDDIINKSIQEETEKPEKENQQKNTQTNPYVRREVSLDEVIQGETMILLALGQSQIANYGGTKYASRERVFNYNLNDGKFYTAVDPLLGTSGNKGNVLTRLGDKIIQKDLYDSVLLVPIAVGASGINSWVPGGSNHNRIIDAIKGLKQHNLQPTHILWHQGSYEIAQQSQAGTENYKANFMNIVKGIRNQGVDAPIYVAISTNSYGNTNPFIQQAQRELVNPSLGIYPGPDSDSITSRWDGIHFSNQGLDQLANGWLHSLVHYP
jgi:hypothetical protein